MQLEHLFGAAANPGSGTARPGSQCARARQTTRPGAPWTVTDPAVGRSRPQAILTSVVLPAPLGPSSPTSSPWPMLQIDRVERRLGPVALRQALALEHRAQCKSRAHEICPNRSASTAPRSPVAPAGSPSTWTGSGAVEPGPPPALDPEAPLPGGKPGGGVRLPADPRRHQLRLGLVPHPAQASRLLGLLHRGLGAGRPLPIRGPLVTGRAAPAERRRGGGGARPGAGPRADGAVRRGAARPRPLPGLSRAGRRRGRRRRLGRGARRRSWRRGMPFFDDPGFYKRAQIMPNDLALAGVAEFSDLDQLTIFADNLVPHVLRVDGVLRYDPELAAHIDAGELLPPGRAGARDPRLRRARLRADRGGAGSERAARSTSGCGTAARRRATRRCRATARAPSSTSGPGAPASPGACPPRPGPRRPRPPATPLRSRRRSSPGS